MRSYGFPVCLLILAEIAGCGATKKHSDSVNLNGVDGGSTTKCVETPPDVSVLASSEWIQLRPPEISERVQLLSLVDAEAGFLALTREKLGTNSKDPLGYQHRLFFSSNGFAWQKRELPENEADRSLRFNDVSYGMSRTVAVGGSVLSGGGALWSTATGEGWRSTDLTLSTPLQGVALTPLGFAAFGDGGIILTSADGVNWASQEHPAAQLRTVACSSDKCVFGGTISFVVLSTQSRDDVSVAKLSCDEARCITDPGGAQHPPPIAHLVYGQGRFWAETQDVGTGPAGFSSVDGTSWTGRDVSKTPQAFLGDLAIRRSEPGKVQVWTDDGAPRTVVVTTNNPNGLSCEDFKCIILRDNFEPQLLLVPRAPKSADCN